MPEIEAILILLVAVTVLATLANRIGVPYPILLVLGGLGLGSPEEMLYATATTQGGVWSVEVMLETGEEDARRQLPPMGLTLEQTEDGTLLRCPTPNLGWMARVLSGLDCSFVVLRPNELRQALERHPRDLRHGEARGDGSAVVARAKPGTPDDVARFAAVSARYGYWNATPEENAAVGISLGF